MKRNFAGPPIMKLEICSAIREMKWGKATGPDSISVEIKVAFEDYGIKNITTLLNEMYDTGQIVPDSPNLHLLHLQKNQGQQSVNWMERSVLWVF